MPVISIPSSFSGARARSYVYKLPLFTRVLLFAIVAAWFAGAVTPRAQWDVRAWAALVPDEVGITSLYRTNTYPFVHLGFIHMVMNVLALTPLLERFESEYGTLTALALFMGRELLLALLCSALPALHRWLGCEMLTRHHA